jgi:hypothetical protein
MGINRIEGLVYGVDDIEKCTQFLDEWGLEKHETNAKGATFTTLENQTFIIKEIGDSSLPVAVEEGPKVREVVWGVDSKETLSKISAEISKDRDVTEDSAGAIHCYDELGIGISFRIENVVDVAEEAPVLNFNRYAPRLNETMEKTQDIRTRPYRIGHVVYNFPVEFREKAVSFYTDRLGFRLTDAVTNMGDFMQCDGSTYHHNWFLSHRGNRTMFNHVAFEVKDLEQIILGGKYMRERNWDTSRNPGRHNLGSNLHWYFKCPLGGEIEYFSDMDRMDENWETRYWDEPPVINFWKAEVVL